MVARETDMRIELVKPWLEHNERRQPLTGCLLHHSAGGTALSSIGHLRTVGLSYHYVIERNGLIYKCVPVSKRAYHAGVAIGRDGGDVNSQTVGICLANDGVGEEYPCEQLAAAHELIYTLCKHHENISWISTHRLVTDRKIDPDHFAFELFASYHGGLEMWRDDSLDRNWNG